MKNRSVLLVLPMLLALTLTGCSGTSSSPAEISPSANVSAPEKPADNSKASAEKAAKAKAEKAAKAKAEKAAKAKAEKAAKAKAEKAAKAKAAREAAQERAAAAQNDPRFDTCKDALAAGYGGYSSGDPEYGWYQDRDGDGSVCER